MSQFSTSNSPKLACHFTCSLSVSVWANWSASQLSQFIIIGTSLFSSVLLLFVMKMFLTSILKLFNPFPYLELFNQMLAISVLARLVLTLCALLFSFWWVGPSASLTAIIDTLAASIIVFVLACIIPYSDAISLYFTFPQLCLIWDCLMSVFLVILSVSLRLPFMRLHLLLTPCNATGIKR